MKTLEMARFMTGVVLFSPLLVVEDTLRHLGVPVSQHGITKNEEGKGMWELWMESDTRTTSAKPVSTKPKTRREQYEEEYQASIKINVERTK